MTQVAKTPKTGVNLDALAHCPAHTRSCIYFQFLSSSCHNQKDSYLVMLDGQFSWQALCFSTVPLPFFRGSLERNAVLRDSRGAVFDEVVVSPFVPSAIFSELGLSLFVSGAVFGEVGQAFDFLASHIRVCS